jgi:hypothetical protein
MGMTQQAVSDELNSAGVVDSLPEFSALFRINGGR